MNIIKVQAVVKVDYAFNSVSGCWAIVKQKDMK